MKEIGSSIKTSSKSNHSDKETISKVVDFDVMKHKIMNFRAFRLHFGALTNDLRKYFLVKCDCF